MSPDGAGIRGRELAWAAAQGPRPGGRAGPERIAAGRFLAVLAVLALATLGTGGETGAPTPVPGAVTASHDWVVLGFAVPLDGWVVFGLAAQSLFAARFLVQWWATERARRVVVPVSFWWLSLVGGLATLVYFAHRHEPVGMAGQFFGLAVYIRNLQIQLRRPAPANDAARLAAGGSNADGV